MILLALDWVMRLRNMRNMTPIVLKREMWQPEHS